MAGGNVPSNLAPIFVAAGRANGIPPQVLAGIASVESSLGQNRSTSSAGAIGLMQFLPSTARSIGIDPLNDSQAIWGAAKLLNQFGYKQNPLRAIGAYNGGPGNPQYGYANQVMSEAGRLAGQLGGVAPASSGQPQQQRQPGTTSVNLPPIQQTVPTFDQAGYDKALHGYRLGQAIKMTSSNTPFDTKQDAQVGKQMSFGGPSPMSLLYQKGVLRSSPPNVADYQGEKTVTQQYQLAQASLGNLASAGHPSNGTKPGSGSIPAQLFPQGTKIAMNRHDAGRDMQVTPNSPVLAPGNGVVIANPSNPGGFGNSYTVAHFTSGPWAGMDVYFGHAQALLGPGAHFTAGQAISRIQNGSGPYVGNSAGMPGWIEIGLWGPSGPLNNGRLPPGL